MTNEMLLRTWLIIFVAFENRRGEREDSFCEVHPPNPFPNNDVWTLLPGTRPAPNIMTNYNSMRFKVISNENHHSPALRSLGSAPNLKSLISLYQDLTASSPLRLNLASGE